MLPIAVDAMGGDFAPRAIVRGVGEALDLLPADIGNLFLVGDEKQVTAELSAIGKLGHPRLTIVHAPEVVRMDEPATVALRSKKNSSIAICVDLVKEGKASAIVSAGHTGASVASAVVKLRPLPGVERPGIATVFPTPKGRFVLIDAGANVDAKPVHLVHYAIMGEAYARCILNCPQPRIGILSIGTEDEKGNELSKNAFKLLSGIPDYRFVGNIEGHDLFEDVVDVVVCDGFVGNVVLKSCESLARALSRILRERLTRNPVRKLGALLARGAFRELKQISDHAEYGGAPLLGINGVLIKAHGSASPKAIRNAVRVAHEFVTRGVNDRIVQGVQRLGSLPIV